jgi:hypothetical protein
MMDMNWVDLCEAAYDGYTKDCGFTIRYCIDALDTAMCETSYDVASYDGDEWWLVPYLEHDVLPNNCNTRIGPYATLGEAKTVAEILTLSRTRI